MNKKLLKRIGNFLAMVILIMEFPAFSFVIALDLAAR